MSSLTEAASWVDEPWLSLDTETTGVDWTRDRVVEVAVVVVYPDGTTGDSFTTVVNPGVEIPEEASAIHGITTDRARDEGVTTADALAEVARRIFDHGHHPIVMFNARFDWPILLAEAERHGVEFPFLAPVLDPFLVDRMVDKYRKGGRKLMLVAQHYAVELDEVDAHGALADAVASARVMRAIVARFPQVGRHSLASVFLRQVRGHEQWRQGFVEYKRRTDPAFDIDPGWPVPSGGLPVIAKIEPGEAATHEGAATGAAAGDTAAPETPTSPGPSLPEGPPDAAGDNGEGVDDARAEPTSTPEPPERGITPADVAKLAGEVFRADYDAAPKGQKTKTLARLRHAFTFACTGLVHCDELDGEQLAVVYQRLHLLQQGAMTYEVTHDGVSFGIPDSAGRAVVAWSQLEPGAAA